MRGSTRPSSPRPWRRSPSRGLDDAGRGLYRAPLTEFGKIEVAGEVTEVRQLPRDGWVHAPLRFS
jgi:hypothetical protein